MQLKKFREKAKASLRKKVKKSLVMFILFGSD